MKSNLTQSWVLPTTWLRFLVIILLLLGLFFRFVNLDRKVWWHDEGLTSLRIAGYTNEEVAQEVFDGRVISVEDLQKYLYPNHEKNLIDTVKSLAVSDVHPPLYFVTLRFWVQCFGKSGAVMRSWSAIISLLAFPAIYWLCLELFESSLIGWIAIILIAVSPFHVLYAQEARHYTLWIVTILLSSAALLRAMRLNTKFSWGIYAITLALGFYSFLFTGLVAIGHGIYVLATERWRLSKTWFAYMFASFGATLTFMPWILVVIVNRASFQGQSAWVTKNLGLRYLVSTWVTNISSVFMDFWYFPSYFHLSVIDVPWGRFFISFILVIVGYSIYFLCRNTPQQVWLFILTLMGVTALALIMPDLISGGYRSSMSRYLTPCYLGIQLAVAYLLATQINSVSNIWQQKLWQIVMSTLITGGVLSCAISSQAEGWSNKLVSGIDLPPVIHIINQAKSPIVILPDGALGHVLAMSHKLKPTVRLQVGWKPDILKITNDFSEVFLYNPSRALKERIKKEQNSKIEPVYEGRRDWLGKLKQQP
jgi:uncharacterized membrane protein